MSPIQGIWSLLFLQVRDLQWKQHRKRGLVLCVARGWLLFITGLQNEEVYPSSWEELKPTQQPIFYPLQDLWDLVGIN